MGCDGDGVVESVEDAGVVDVGVESKMVGKRFGKLVIEKFEKRTPNSLSRCFCRCDCGNTIEIGWAALKKRTSCGCDYLDPRSDLTGKKFGKLTVEERVLEECVVESHDVEPHDVESHEVNTSQVKTRDNSGRSPYFAMKWKCKCECGGEITATTLALKAGIITSCGCTAADEVTLDLANIDRGNIEGTSTIALQGTLDGVMYENNNSGVRGVYYSNTYHCYWATIVFKGKNHFLGRYKALEDAARARRQAEDILYSAFMDHYKEDLEPQVEAETERDKKDRFADFVENLKTTSEERIAVVIPGKYEEGFCQVCGKKIPKQSRGRKKYCSDSCLGLAKKRKTVRTGNAHQKQIICPDCGKIAWVGYRSKGKSQRE